MNRSIVVVVAALAACITTVNPVRFTRETGAPTLPSRADNCPVDIVDDGTKFTRPHKLIGHVVLEWSATQMKDQGPDYALRTLRSAACEQGAHVVINMRALPRGFNEGMIYEGDLAVLLDENGDPLQGKMTGTSVSHGGTDAEAPDAGPQPIVSPAAP
jgi:hypothetical protein